MNDPINRYLDFSTEQEDINAFLSSTEAHPALAHYSAEIQRYVGQQNPVTAIRGLIALQAATEAAFMIRQRTSRNITNTLLGVIAVLLAYIAATMQ